MIRRFGGFALFVLLVGLGIIGFAGSGYSQVPVISAHQAITTTTGSGGIALPVNLSRDTDLSDDPQSSAQAGSTSQNQSYDLSAKGKLKYGLKLAFLSPYGYLGDAVGAAYNELTIKRLPNKTSGDRVADGASFFAQGFATGSTKSLTAFGIYPVIFNQDPHYYPSHMTRKRDRIFYAATRVFINQGRFNSSLVLGDATASILTNAWVRNTPDNRSTGAGPTFARFGAMIGFDALQYVVLNEFGADIKHKIFKR